MSAQQSTSDTMNTTDSIAPAVGSPTSGPNKEDRKPFVLPPSGREVFIGRYTLFIRIAHQEQKCSPKTAAVKGLHNLTKEDGNIKTRTIKHR